MVPSETAVSIAPTQMAMRMAGNFTKQIVKIRRDDALLQELPEDIVRWQMLGRKGQYIAMHA